MIVCTNCGNHNQDSDEFCGSCGKFLEWVGERVEAPAAKTEEPEPEEVVEAKVGIIDRVKAAVGGEGSGATLPAEPTGPAPEELEAAAAAAAAEADADQRRLEAEAAEAERRAAQAEEEAQRRIQHEAEAKRQAEEEAKARAEAEAKARAEAEERRQQELEAARKAQAEEAALAAAQAQAERAAEAARQAQIEAERAAATEAERLAAEAEAARQAQEAREAAEALEAAKRAEELARAAAEAEAAARAEAEAKAKAEAEARKQAEEDAKRRAEDEARARIAAEQRAREEDEARKRAAALLARPKAPVVPVEEVKPADDPFVTPTADSTPTSAATPTAMTPAAAAAQKPTAQTPVAQQPTSAKAPPRRDPKQTAAAETVKTGDLVCSQCGSGNDPTRKFCRKCGNSLAKAVPAKKVPWWKKLFGGKKSRTSKDASDKARRRQKAQDASFKTQMVIGNLKKIVLVAMALGLLGGNFYFPSARGEITRRLSSGVRSVQDMFNPQVVAVNSLEPTATSAVPGKEAKFAGDLVVNTYWAEGAEGDGIGETITFTFAEPTDLTKVLMTVGSTDDTENYLNHPRPKKLHLVFDNGGSADLDLEDEFRKAQGFNLKGAKGVSKVDIVISEVYPGRGGTDTGIAEVEFKKKG